MLRLLQLVSQRPKAQERPVVYYDGDCGMCEAAVSLLQRLDILRRFTWTPFQTLDAPPAGLAWADLDRAAYLRTADGRLHEGFHAFRRIALGIPLLLPLAPLLCLPGLHLIGVVVYRWVAWNRKKLGCRRPSLRMVQAGGSPRQNPMLQ